MQYLEARNYKYELYTALVGVGIIFSSKLHYTPAFL
jgi:hypothetical protein